MIIFDNMISVHGSCKSLINCVKTFIVYTVLLNIDSVTVARSKCDIWPNKEKDENDLDTVIKLQMLTN